MMPDIYIQLAADAFKKPPADVTSAEREYRFNKTFEFQCLYGGHPRKYDATTQHTNNRCRMLYCRLHRKFPNPCKS